MVGAAAPVPCQRCLPCLINRRRIWQWRMYLESLTYDASSFITLTYDEEHAPVNSSLDPRHYVLWLKRLRKALAPRRVRFFLCGEYGDKTLRPHYHASLFGVGFLDWSTVAEAWQKGFVHTAEFNETTAQYVAGYVTKKWTVPGAPGLGDRHPEFARQSNRPGLGAGAMAVISERLHSEAGLDEMLATGDVPMALRFGRRSIPLGRYLRSVLRKEMGFTDEMVERVKSRWYAEKTSEFMQFLQSPDAYDPQWGGSYKNFTVAQNQGRIWSIEGKSRIYNRRFL